MLRALREQSPLISDAASRAPEGQYETGSTAGEWVARRIRNLRLKNRKVGTLLALPGSVFYEFDA